MVTLLEEMTGVDVLVVVVVMAEDAVCDYCTRAGAEVLAVVVALV